MPSAESIAAATEQASAPTAEHQLNRVAATQDGCNAGLIAKLAKHTGSSKAPDAPTGASFSNDVRKHVRFAQLQQKLAELSTVDAAFDAEDLDDDALLEAARELDEHSSLVEYCCSGLEALCVQGCRPASTHRGTGPGKRCLHRGHGQGAGWREIDALI